MIAYGITQKLLSKAGAASAVAAAATTVVFGSSLSKHQFSVMASEAGNPDPAKAANIYGFSALDIDGNQVSMEKYRGHVCVVVNVASQWGKTDVNYKQLVEMHEKHSEADGLRILAFPCHQFNQEFKKVEDIKNFAAKYNVKFDMYHPIDVNGKNAHPMWEYMKNKQAGTLGNFIKWNFTKFVIDKEGVAVARFGTTENPMPKLYDKVKSLF